MKTENTTAPKAEINVTPLVDVVLVLLIIFMVLMPLMVTQGIQLPRSDNSKNAKQNESKSISMTADGLLYFEQQLVSEDGLIEQLRALHGTNPAAQVVLRADRRLLYGDVHHVLDVATGAGFQNLALLAEPGMNSSLSKNPD